MRQRALYVAALAFAVGLATAVARPAQAQSGQNDIRQIQPRFTRVFSSDRVRIAGPQVSPDGRWMVFADRPGAEATAGLRLLSVEGGEPIVLTSGSHDVAPDWFPTSDRIAFYSDAVDGIMTIAIDPNTGAPRGPAKRITLEPVMRPGLVSPDGRWIAYRVFADEGAANLGMALRIVPARGGNARTVIQLPRRPAILFWSNDSRYVYYLWSDPEGTPAKLWRVAIDGGAPEVVEHPPADDSAPAQRYQVVREGPTASGGDVVYQIQTWDERPVARVALPQNMRVPRITPDGRYLIAVVQNTVQALRVLPVVGGAVRQLGDGGSREAPLGWTPDSRRIIYRTQLDGRIAVMAVPAGGGAAEEFTIVPDLQVNGAQTPVFLSESARYLAFVGPDERGSRTGKIARVSDGEVRQVADSATLVPPAQFHVAFAGGSASKGDEFLYVAARGDRREVRAGSFEGHSQLIRSFPMDLGTKSAAAVFENRIAWLQAAGDSVAVLIADGPGAPARRLALIDGLSDELAFSPDGRWLAGTFYQNSETTEHPFKILVIPLTPDGKTASAPRLIDTQIGVGWDIRWLPDSRALTIFAQTLPDYRTDVWLFPIGDGGEPVAITRDESAEFWSYQLSPDGRNIAYPAEFPRGSSVWMIDLGDALTSGGR